MPPVWHLDSTRCPKCDPQSIQGPSALQSASIRNPPCGKHNNSSGVRSLIRAGPGTTSKSVPEAPEGRIL
eukprot:2964570-Alexandrium_andersonii.AAC.1